MAGRDRPCCEPVYRTHHRGRWVDAVGEVGERFEREPALKRFVRSVRHHLGLVERDPYNSQGSQ